jgi:hypothetical protein
MPATPDQIRTAIRRLSQAREAEQDAKAAAQVAQERMNSTNVAANAAARDLAALTGSAAFVLDGKLVTVVHPFGAGAASFPTITFLSLTDVTHLEPLPVPVPPPTPPVTTEAVHKLIPVKAAPLSGGKVPDVKGK